MDPKWKKLIENFEENGYKPSDIQMIVHFYDTIKELHIVFKKYYEEDENDSNH